MGKIVEKHKPCSDCGSSDAKAVYEDNSSYCFSCKKYRPSPTAVLKGQLEFKPDAIDEAQLSRAGKMFTIIEQADCGPILSRKISSEVTKFFGVRVSYDENRKDIRHAYPYLVGKDGVAQAYKVRDVAGKKFSSIGKIKGLCGKHLFPSGGKRLVITEGEIDMLSIAQASLEKYGKIYPVVSVRSATTLDQDLLEHREWIRSFDEVVYCKDADDRGEESAAKINKIIGMDKVKIATFGKWKDPNECLMNEGAIELNHCIWNSQHLVPSGIITKEKLWDALCNYNEIESVPYPECVGALNSKIKGMRLGEIDLFISGTGSGKSTLFREIILHYRATTDEKIGIISLEEAPAETARRISGMYLKVNTAEITLPIETLKVGFDAVFGDDHIMLLDHQGSVEDGALLDMIEYMALMGCTRLFLDHITIAVSEGAGKLTGNEAVDSVMSSLLKIVKKHNIWLGVISHLRKAPSGKRSFEEGELPSLDDIKGSGSIKQISFGVIAFARDQLNPDPIIRSTINFSVLKNRYTGLTGPVEPTYYNNGTGRLQLEEPGENFMIIQPDEYDVEVREARELAIEQLAFEGLYKDFYVE